MRKLLSCRANARRMWFNIGCGVVLLGGATAMLPAAVTSAAPHTAAAGTANLHQTAHLTSAHVTQSALAVAACSSTQDFMSVAGQGPLCQAQRSFVLRLRSGRRMTVAPPDTALGLAGLASAAPRATSSLLPQQCVPSGTPRVELFYAHFAGQPDNFASHVADIQQMFRDVDTDYIAYDAAYWFGENMHLNVECDGSGNPVVHDVALSTPLSGSDFSTIVSDMENQGYNQNYVHYWIWTDGNPVAAYGYAGQSTIQEDDTAGASNSINTAYEYSVDYGYTESNYGPQVFAHENGHAMGAVQLSAPDSTGAFHCTDGTDVMCYDDGGPHGASYTSTDCVRALNSTAVFDCHFNDYFNPNPPAGSYLATHWNLGSANNHWVYIGPVSSATSLSASESNAVYSQPVAVTATVSSSLGPVPSGTVTFSEGSNSLGTAAVSSGTARLTLTTLGAGQHTISASFGGSGFIQGSSSSNTVNVTVSQASTTTSLASSANPVGSNVPFTLTATVSPQAPATGAPTGSVTFYQGSNVLGTAPLSGGQAALSATLSSGTYSLWAAYAGQGSNWQGSDDQGSQLTLTVMCAVNNTLQSSASNNSAPVGATLQFTATLQGGSCGGGTPAPSGTLTFEDGATPISAPMQVGGGALTLTTTQLAPGVHIIAAVYSGDATYAPSTATLTETVRGWTGFYEMDAYGALHPIDSPNLHEQPRLYSWPIARGISLTPGGTSGYTVDGWGGMHPFGGAPRAIGNAYWPGWDIARGIAVRPDGKSGYTLDGWGGVHPFGGAPPVVGYAYWPGWDIARGIVLRADGKSGYTLDGWGGVHPFGVRGDVPPTPSGTAYFPGFDIGRSLVLRPDGLSGYEIDGWGGIHAFGGAPTLVGSQYWAGHDVARGLVLMPGFPTEGYVIDAEGDLAPFGGAPAVPVPSDGRFASPGAVRGLSLQ